MKTKVLPVFILYLFFLAEIFLPAARAGESGPDVGQWISEQFAEKKVPPFSFVYGGRSSDLFITRWDYRRETVESADPAREESVVTYSDRETGLAVRCFLTRFRDFPAVEWVLKFQNRSDRNTPLLEKAAVLRHSFTGRQSGPFLLHRARGSNAERSDFQPIDTELKVGDSVYMTPSGGRSSDTTAFPFFNLELPGQQGVVAAVGWSGKWYAEIQRPEESALSVKAGMEKMQLVLYPREEIRTPRIALLFWEGADRMTGHNRFRQFILAHHTRKIGGKMAELPFAAGLGYGGPAPCNEYSCLTESYAVALVDRFRRFRVVPEVFWIDAGWYTGCGNWWEHVGNWTVNRENFPNGLKPVADAIHRAGAKFILWFEPERVRKGTLIEQQHPEWLLGVPGSPDLLFDLGNRDALAWLTGTISDTLAREGVDYYRQDFNFDPWRYWERKDTAQRIGMAEIRHIEGLYEYWDALLARFPNLVIDNCASGGRRIDLETVSRSSPLWRTDYQYGEPNGYQCHTYGLHFYLPLHGTGNFTFSPYHFRSSLGSALVVAWDVNSREMSQAAMQKYIADFKRLRPYFYEDYYPLTPVRGNTGNGVWLACQFHRPKESDGIILAFRREESQEDTLPVRLRGLVESAVYEMHYEDYGLTVRNTGRELMEGIRLSIPQRPASLLAHYRQVESRP